MSIATFPRFRNYLSRARGAGSLRRAPVEWAREDATVPFNLEVFGSAFAMIFLAELGDKTQISTFAFASESPSRLSVFLGAALALVCTSFIGVALGSVVGRFVPERLLKAAAALVFLGFGGWTLVQAIRG